MLNNLLIACQHEFSSGVAEIGDKLPIHIPGMDLSMMAGSSWSLDNLFGNAKSKFTSWGGAFLMAFGIILIIVGGFKIGKGLMNHGKEQTSWFINILLIVVGAAMSVGGLKLFTAIGKGGYESIDSLGTN